MIGMPIPTKAFEYLGVKTFSKSNFIDNGSGQYYGNFRVGSGTLRDAIRKCKCIMFQVYFTNTSGSKNYLITNIILDPAVAKQARASYVDTNKNVIRTAALGDDSLSTEYHAYNVYIQMDSNYYSDLGSQDDAIGIEYYKLA